MSKNINWFKKVFLLIQKKTGVKWVNSIVYFTALIICVGLIYLSFFNCFSSEWQTLFVSLGASGVASVFLAFFIEMSNEKVNTTRRLAMRHNKLISVVKQTEVSAEQIIMFYFEFREEILGYVDDKCHIITLPQLIVELKKLKEQWPQIIEKIKNKEDATEKYQKLNENINSWMRGIASKIDYIEKSLYQYEAQGYFTNREVSSLLHAKKQLGSLDSNTDIINVDKYNGAIIHLLTLPEFFYLKDTSFYCKYCCVAIKEYFLLSGFTAAGINEVVTHEERMNNF